MSASREKKLRQESRTDPQKHQKNKRSPESADKFRRNIVIIIVVVLVLSLAAVLFVNSSLPQQMMTAVTIDREKVSVAEYNYMYYRVRENLMQTYQQYGITVPADTDEYDPTAGTTFSDYYDEEALAQLKTIIIRYEQALDANIALSDESIATIDNYMVQLSSAAKSYDMSANDFLSANYGRGVTESVLRRFLEKSLLGDQWTLATTEAYTYTNEDYEAEYAAAPTDYDLVTYRSMSFSTAVTDDTTEMTEDEQTAATEDAKASAKTAADSMLSELTTWDDFDDVAAAYADPAAEQTDAASSLKENVAFGSLSAALQEYLFDETRKVGDKAVIEDSSAYVVVMFDHIARNETPSVNVRHILFMAASDSDVDMDTARSKAAQTLSDWKSGAATEDSFAALANERTEDTGSNTKGGLYDRVTPGEMVPNFNAWCFDSSRKPGDTGIVENKGNYNGVHVMYYIGTDLQTWAVQAESKLSEAAYTATLNAKLEPVEPKISSFAMRFAHTTRAV